MHRQTYTVSLTGYRPRTVAAINPNDAIRVYCEILRQLYGVTLAVATAVKVTVVG